MITEIPLILVISVCVLGVCAMLLVVPFTVTVLLDEISDIKYKLKCLKEESEETR